MATTPIPTSSPEVLNSPSTPFGTNTNNIVTLQVGDRRFTTRTNTLTEESPVFSSLLSGKWADKQPDGSYFIDADPAIFSHTLRYLISSILPLFYTPTTGHDYALYTALLQQAQYFQIARLEAWLVGKRYHQVLKTELVASVVENGAEGVHEMLGTDVVGVECWPTWTTEKVYVCPREIGSHRGNPRGCGRLCRNARGEGEAEFVDEEVLKIVKVVKRVVFDQGMCFDG